MNTGQVSCARSDAVTPCSIRMVTYHRQAPIACYESDCFIPKLPVHISPYHLSEEVFNALVLCLHHGHTTPCRVT